MDGDLVNAATNAADFLCIAAVARRDAAEDCQRIELNDADATHVTAFLPFLGVGRITRIARSRRPIRG